MQEMRGPRIGDAASLWNCTAAPGWTREEAQVLKLCLMRYGVGQWQAIQGAGLLPGKLIQQLYGQTQRLLGQQSLAAFTGLQVDVDRVRADNEQRSDVQRKGGLIIYSGPPPSRQLKEQWRREAKEKYGLGTAQIEEVSELLEEVARQRVREQGQAPGAGHAGVAAAATAHGSATAAPFGDIMSDEPAGMPRELKLRLLQRLSMRLAWALARLKKSLGLPADDVPHDEDAEAGLQAGSGSEAGLSSGAGSAFIQPGAVPTRSTWLGNSSRRQGKAERGAGKKPAKSTAQKRKARRPRAQGSSSDSGGEEDGGHEWGGGRGGVGGRGRGKGMESCGDDEAEDCGFGGGLGIGDGGGGGGGRGRPPKAPRRAKAAAKEAEAVALLADVATLVDMGFSQRKAREALHACDGDVQAACEWLFAIQ